jgi:hypothetical protein
VPQSRQAGGRAGGQAGRRCLTPVYTMALAVVRRSLLAGTAAPTSIRRRSRCTHFELCVCCQSGCQAPSLMPAAPEASTCASRDRGAFSNAQELPPQGYEGHHSRQGAVSLQSTLLPATQDAAGRAPCCA